MIQNVFDIGYKISFVKGIDDYAELVKFGEIPLLHFYRHREKCSNFCYRQKDTTYWTFRDSQFSDDLLNKYLPSDWSMKAQHQFKDMKEIRSWLENNWL